MRVRSAQSLLEAILAIAVILTATISATTLVVTTINAGQVSEDKTLAANLAREGFEVVRGMRDTNWLKRAENIVCGSSICDWNNSLGAGTYVATFDGATWTLESGATNKAVISRTTSGKTFLTSGACPGGETCPSTGFTRTIDVSYPTETVLGTNLAPLQVVVTVTWKNTTKTFSLTEKLYDWR